MSLTARAYESLEAQANQRQRVELGRARDRAADLELRVRDLELQLGQANERATRLEGRIADLERQNERQRVEIEQLKTLIRKPAW